MDSIEVAKAVARLRRAMPRNPDILLVCEAAEQSTLSANTKPIPDRSLEPVASDREAHNRFMRDYMRQYRKRTAHLMAK